MGYSLLVDFGASRIKTAIFDGNSIIAIKDYLPIKPLDVSYRKYVVCLKDIEMLFRSIVDEYSKNFSIKDIFVCSEMHGFIVKNSAEELLTDYISWKDESCLNVIDGISSFERLKNTLADDFFKITGMNFRPCYPIFKLYHMVRNGEISEKRIKVESLPEWLCGIDGLSANLSHATMGAGLGFYNINSGKIDNSLVKIFNDLGVELSFNSLTTRVQVGGYLKVNNNKVPIYTGVGDHQCAVLGAGNDESTISINLGTGSQVSAINLTGLTCERRPFFNGDNLSVITHIPSGRSLNCFIGFLREINPNRNFWKDLASITLKDFDNADLQLDLAVFSSAWNFLNFGSIVNIREGNFTLRNFLASLLRSYVKQYEKAIETLHLNKKRIILSGGVAKKIPLIGEYFRNKGYEVILPKSDVDETLVGLSLFCKNKEKNDEK